MSQRPLRIAAHNGAPEWGGAEIALCRVLAGLRERGHDVRLYCNREVVAGPAREDFGLDVEMLHLGGDAALHHALRLRTALTRYDADAFIVGTFRKLLLAGMGARLAGVPRVVARVGLSTDTPRNAKYRFVLRHWVDRIVVNSTALEEAYRKALPGEAGERVRVIRTGVREPPSPGDPEELRRSVGIRDGAPVVGAVARLVGQKRLDRFLRVLARLPDSVHGVIAGDGPDEAELAELARELEVDGRTHFLGYRNDVGTVLEAVDLLLVTSDREGMSNAMLEALARGVPVVSTPVSGAREALEPLDDGRAPGAVTDTFDVDELVEVVRGILDDPRGLEAMGRTARERSEARFSREAMLTEWEEVLGR